LWGFGFLEFGRRDRLHLVSIRLTIFRFLSVLAVCGWIAAPLTPSAFATLATPGHAAAAASSDGVATDGMGEDMPCCPKKAPPGCQDCPMMSLCQPGTIVSLSSETSLIVFSGEAGLLPLLNEADLSGQAQGPPRRPPKA
jgi:hypothetical protein